MLRQDKLAASWSAPLPADDRSGPSFIRLLVDVTGVPSFKIDSVVTAFKKIVWWP